MKSGAFKTCIAFLKIIKKIFKKDLTNGHDHGIIYIEGKGNKNKGAVKMFVENRYIGNQEYVIAFKNGTHRIIEVDDINNDTIFTGSYDECDSKLVNMDVSYRESLF